MLPGTGPEIAHVLPCAASRAAQFPIRSAAIDVDLSVVDPSSARVTVVVPVLNEERCIARLLDHLAGEVPRPEVVVVDGGSRDGTVAAASAHPGVRVLAAPRGRARQMNAGARAAAGDVLLFLHADTTLPRGAVERVRAAVAAGADFGCFELRIESDDPRLRLASRMISLRSRLIPSATGDQAQFFRREFFFGLGGYPDLPLFEDMKLVGLAARAGRYACLDLEVGTSARRWHAHGVNSTIAKMLALRSLYHLGVDPRVLARYYRTHPRDESTARSPQG